MAKKASTTIDPKKLQKIVEAIGGLEKWSKNCHTCSLAIVRTGLLPSGARVARGWHPQVRSQHSWVVIGDPYNDASIILDGTLWSYLETEPVLFCGKSRKHTPHGKGKIWDVGVPPDPTDKIIELDVELSEQAKDFMRLIAPDGLDFQGWHILAKSPVQGWPSKEIITAMYNTKQLRALIGIDIVGMATDLNPGQLYW